MMFSPWEAFYQMTGEVAATLMGLLFIVVTLLSGRPRAAVLQGARLFNTPTVFNLASVLAVSALALAPDGTDEIRAALIGAWAASSLVYAAGIAAGLRAIETPTHWSDPWCYGFAPAAIYLALTAAAVAAWADYKHAVSVVAACLMALLLVTIRNAWDLVTWLAPRDEL